MVALFHPVASDTVTTHREAASVGAAVRVGGVAVVALFGFVTHVRLLNDAVAATRQQAVVRAIVIVVVVAVVALLATVAVFTWVFGSTAVAASVDDAVATASRVPTRGLGITGLACCDGDDAVATIRRSALENLRYVPFGPEAARAAVWTVVADLERRRVPGVGGLQVREAVAAFVE
jgi:hypothetical protein